jgi:hypothetical protein
MSDFLFELRRPQSNSTMTVVFTKKFGEYKDGKFSLDFKKIEEFGLGGFLKVLNGSAVNTVYKFTGGTDLCVDVNKRYAWDKKEVICNQPVNYYCSKGWVGSIIAFIKDKFKINETAL